MNNEKISELNRIFKWLATYELTNISSLTLNNIDFENQPSSDSTLIRFVKKFIGDHVYVRTEKIEVANHGKNFVGYLTNIGKSDDYTGIVVKQSAKDGYKKVGTASADTGRDFLLIYYSSSVDEQKVLSEILSNLGYDNDICSYIKHFIKTGAILNLSPEQYERFLKKGALEHTYLFEEEEMEKSEISVELSRSDIYDLLASETSYDDHCPFCNQISTLSVSENGQNLKNFEARNSLIAMLVAKYQEQDIYVKILCCKSCFEEYKNALKEARIKNIDGKNYKKLVLIREIATNDRRRDVVNTISLSPDNWNIICQFNGINQEP